MRAVSARRMVVQATVVVGLLAVAVAPLAAAPAQDDPAIAQPVDGSPPSVSVRSDPSMVNVPVSVIGPVPSSMVTDAVPLAFKVRDRLKPAAMRFPLFVAGAATLVNTRLVASHVPATSSGARLSLQAALPRSREPARARVRDRDIEQPPSLDWCLCTASGIRQEWRVTATYPTTYPTPVPQGHIGDEGHIVR